MQIKSVIPYILALTFVCGCGNADKTARKGEAALAIGEYYGAAEYFKKAYTQTPSKDKPKRALLALKMGQCYAPSAMPHAPWEHFRTPSATD